MNFLNRQITCGPELPIGDTQSIEKNTVLRSSNNSQTLYIDGAGEGDWPIYLGITKSRGTQESKLPLEKNDIIGGLQVYSRIKEGDSLGYSYEETPLSGSLIFKVSESNSRSTELLIAVLEDDALKVRVVLDSSGNLKVAGTISLGDLTITDQLVEAGDTAVKFVKAIFNNQEYAIPLYPIQGT